jgi:hypothetical protein
MDCPKKKTLLQIITHHRQNPSDFIYNNERLSPDYDLLFLLSMAYSNQNFASISCFSIRHFRSSHHYGFNYCNNFTECEELSRPSFFLYFKHRRSKYYPVQYDRFDRYLIYSRDVSFFSFPPSPQRPDRVLYPASLLSNLYQAIFTWG